MDNLNIPAKSFNHSVLEKPEDKLKDSDFEAKQLIDSKISAQI